MWTRRELKERAKEALHRNYWKIVFVAALAAILSGGYASSTSNGINRVSNVTEVGAASEEYGETGTEQDVDFAAEVSDEILADEIIKTADDAFENDTQRIILFVTAAFVFLFVFMFFIAAIVAAVELLYNPFYVGVQRFMLKSVDDRAQVKETAYGFDHSYKNVVKTMFHRDLRVFLWALLLVIPGIYKKYQYRMVSYILAEHPDMGYREVLQMSKDMMNGEKWRAFVLDLSFIPWHLLGMITCGMVELFYVNSYVRLTDAALYRAISAKDEEIY